MKIECFVSESGKKLIIQLMLTPNIIRREKRMQQVKSSRQL